jgi:hypothetical protein
MPTTAASRDTRKSACFGVGVSSSIIASACAEPPALCAGAAANCAGASLPPSAPSAPAASTIAGNGTAKAKIATNAAAAIAHKEGDLSARVPMRHAACSTMAVTAGLMP